MTNVHTLYRTTDPETSKEAAVSISDKLTAIQDMVLTWAKERGVRGFIDADLERAFHEYGPSTLRTRRNELVARGLIEDSGFRVTVHNNRRRIVWRAT